MRTTGNEVRGQRWLVAMELAAVLAMGILLVTFFYRNPGNATSGEIGAPGFDSFYHTKMAALMPEIGLVRDFPWLREVYFSQLNSDFISHHVGFQVLLIPFVKVSHWLTGDYLPGGRWAISMFFGLAIVMLDVLLMHRRVRWRWLWLVVFLLLPAQFFSRHTYIRAIAPSLVFMLMIVWLLFQERHVWLAIAMVAYTHLYLGSVVYTPVIVGVYVGCSLLGVRDERRFPWRVAMWAFFGWLVGLRTYPYFDGAIEFLGMQIFGTGLDPDIAVGSEWNSYDNVWSFGVGLCGPMLAVWAGALVLRIRCGGRLDARETTLLVLNFAFLFLTLKAKRFIEYWPAFCMLSAAYMSAPIVNRWAEWFDESVRTGGRLRRLAPLGLSIVLGGVGVAAVVLRFPEGIESFSEAWVWWTPLAVALTLPFVIGCWVLKRQDGSSSTVVAGLVGTVTTVSVAAFVFSVVVMVCARQITRLQRDVYCGFDLPAIRDAMDYLRQVSEPGDVVFTDDWDVFGVYFYHNSHNNYLVGLDPKFTHSQRPDLWERYVKITRGQVPRKFTASWTGHSGERESRELDVKLEDIRDYFKARYVIVDSDHKSFSGALAKAPDFAELIYPTDTYSECRNDPYLIFRVRGWGDRSGSVLAGARVRAADKGLVFLSDLEPVESDQGWGTLMNDRSVAGSPIRLGGTFYRRGIGTHAPMSLVYDVPPDVERFEATVGVHSRIHGVGSAVVRVLLDGEQVYKSTLLRSDGDPVVVSLAVAGASRIELRADATEDGNRWDHVDWGRAGFVRSAPAAPKRVQVDRRAGTSLP